MAIPTVTTWLSNIFAKEKGYRMKRENGYKSVTQSFFGISRAERHCDKCNTTYYEGALDFLLDEFSCPRCVNGKDENETSIRYRD